eukprot:gene15221-20505_t
MKLKSRFVSFYNRSIVKLVTVLKLDTHVTSTSTNFTVFTAFHLEDFIGESNLVRTIVKISDYHSKFTFEMKQSAYMSMPMVNNNFANRAAQFPTFMTSNAPQDFTDFDFNFLNEYLFEEERQNFNNTNNNNNNNNNLQLINQDQLSDVGGYSSSEDDTKETGQTGNKKRKSTTEGKSKSKDQIDRRRERNRILARKTRMRKKFFFESLQKQVTQLATENEMLKNLIKARLPSPIKNKLLSECTTDIPQILSSCSSEVPTSILENADYKLMSAIQAAQRSFVITDPSLLDNPIIFASKGFLELSGYSLDQVLGRNCRFMQGSGSDPQQIEALRKGIQEGVDTSVCLLNYRADGSQFYNQIFVAALRDSNMKIINYVGVQVEVKGFKNLSSSLPSDVTNNLKMEPQKSKETSKNKSKSEDST